MSPKASTRLLATQSDERLAAMARAGHDRAFEALVYRYRPPLLRYCRRLSIPDSRAEDVVQQALLQAWSALRRGAAVRELRPWLYRIAHNTAINLARDSARDGSGLALDLDSVSGADSAVVLEPDLAGGLHLRDTLTDMAALPDLQREVIFRTALAGHSHEEVATALGITDGAVRGLLYRARATLRAAITAITPPPLIAWISGPGQGVATERVGEIAAGGGLGAGVLAKGALALFAAGTLITGAAIVHSPPGARRHAHAAPTQAKRQIAALAAPPRSAEPSVDAGRAGPATPASTTQRFAGRKPVRLRIAMPAPSGSSHTPAFSHRHPSAPAANGPAPTSTTLHIPVSSTTPPPSSGSSSSGSSPGAGGGSSGSGSAGGGSGTGAGGSGGSGSGGGPPGGGSSGGGSGGSTGGGAPPESSSPPPPTGSGSPSTGPVTTVVHEVTGLLEHTVHGVLGHDARLDTPASTSAPPGVPAGNHRPCAEPSSDAPHNAAHTGPPPGVLSKSLPARPSRR